MVVPILLLLVLHFFICFLSRKSMWIRYLISGRPAIVMSPKGINFKELKKLNMNLDDLIEAFSNIKDENYRYILQVAAQMLSMLKRRLRKIVELNIWVMLIELIRKIFSVMKLKKKLGRKIMVN